MTDEIQKNLYYSLIKEKVLAHFPADSTLKKTQVDYIDIKIPPQTNFEDYDITEYIKYKKIEKILIRFEKVLKNKLSHCDLSAFYINLKSLDFREKLSLGDMIYKVLNRNLIASYSTGENKLTVYRKSKSEEEKEDDVTHELLHMASSRDDGEYSFCGFEEWSYSGIYLGRGLNEGYTEYLNQKYFSNIKDNKSYAKERHLAAGIEKIVGTKLMEQLYFSSNLHDLIIKLSEYSPQSEVIKLIKKMDDLNTTKDYDEKEKIYEELKREIAAIYRIKQNKEYINGKINGVTLDKRNVYVTQAYLSDILVSDDPHVEEKNGELIIEDDSTRIRIITDQELYDKTHPKVLEQQEKDIERLNMYDNDQETNVNSSNKKI